jgi:AraC-like DNA-binding protein
MPWRHQFWMTASDASTQAGTNATAPSFEISFAQLETRPDVIRRARTRLLHSPIYTLLHGHMARLCEGVGDVELTDTGPFVGDATVLLTRAAIASVGGTGAGSHNAVKEVLYQRVVEYIVQHLREPDMTPQRIAAAHNISFRHLYRLWAQNEVSIAEWIMRERLAGAARDLRDATQNATPVATIARTWGFSDPAHFSRRFRHAYSVPPRSWRHDAQASATLPGLPAAAFPHRHIGAFQGSHRPVKTFHRTRQSTTHSLRHSTGDSQRKGDIAVG